MKDKRLIEEAFPIKEVSAEAAREKSIRHGHISTLHLWWARRPLASSRATNYAALVSTPKDIGEWRRELDFIIDLCRWENSLDRELMSRARRNILHASSDPPRVLDPFAGGGAIPLEALRLGCEVHSSDYNPVAVLIQRCTLEYPQKFGNRGGGDKWTGLEGKSGYNSLLEDVKKWGKWVLEEAKAELAKYYPQDPDGAVPVGFLWARTIPCQNPSCGVQIPLIRQFWLVNKPKRKLSLYAYVGDQGIEFKIVGKGHDEFPNGFDPSKGTISRAIVTCLVCGSSVKAKTTRRLFKEGKSGQRMIAVVLIHRQRKGKAYRIASEEDLRVFHRAETQLRQKEPELKRRWGINPVPDEEFPNDVRMITEPLGSAQNYHFKVWGDLFNSRQKLTLITLTDVIRRVCPIIVDDGGKQEYARAVVSYLALNLDRIANQCSTLSRWNNAGEKIEGPFSRPALPMLWDYVELNPFSGSTGNWESALDWITRVIAHTSETSGTSARVFQSSATSLPYDEGFFDAVLTDPPYYDNAPYAYLSDFFYVWLKRTIGNLYPSLFSTPLTPKTNEIVAYMRNSWTKEEAKKNYEGMLKSSFGEIHRVLKPDGIAIIVYAHKSISGWETLINSLLDSGLVITGSWPIRTELKERLTAKQSAALASSIYIVARKIKREPTGLYIEVKEELRKYLNQKLRRLWEEGIGGADFFIAAIGSAIEVFGRFEKVIGFEGDTIMADRLLDEVREIATDYAVRQILPNGFAGDISDLARLYVLWRWEFGEVKVPFDEGRKLAHSCGIDLSQTWNRGGFVRKEKEFVRLLGPHERDFEKLQDPQDLIDVLHLALKYWEMGRRDEMTDLLSGSGFGQTEAFYHVAQAISETLPLGSKEKKLLDGFLAGRERVREEVRTKMVQTKLIE